MATTYMDTDKVSSIADGVQTAGEVLNAVNMALEAAIMMLKLTAFVGMFGNMAMARFLEQIQPRVEKLAKKCEEMSGDLNTAVSLHRQGEERGDSI